MKNKTLLVIAPGRNTPDVDCCYDIFVAKTGEHLASHICSSAVFAYVDLYDRRQGRKDEWTERFGELEVKYIDETDISEKQLLERNKKWYDELDKELQA